MMMRKIVLTVVASGALALGAPALAQSVTYAPPPSENLVRLQDRVVELERALQQATGENERLDVELRRARAENEQLKQQLTQASAPAAPAEPVAGAPPPSAAAGALGTAPLSAAPTDAAQQALAEAMRLLRLGRFPEAQAAFTAFVSANPRSPDAPEARYFIGRTQLAQRNFADAGDTFVKLLTEFPAIPRAPDSWVMLGVALNGVGKTAEACKVFSDLSATYPRASAATRQTAANEARTAQCAPR